MKKFNLQLSKIFTLSLVLILVIFQSGCLKKQNLDEENLGPSIEPLELTKALGEGFGSLDYNDIKPKESSRYILTQKIQDSYVDTIEEQNIDIVSATNSVEALSLDLILTKTKYAGGQAIDIPPRSWKKNFPKSEAQTTLNSDNEMIQTRTDNDEPTFLFFVFQSLAFGACNSQSQIPETCHKLDISDFQYKVPFSAASQHSCEDPSRCYIKARKIEFDMIRNTLLDKDGKPKRTHYTVIVSKEVPFLSRVLQFCSRSLYEMNSNQQKVLADLCYTITDYKFAK